MTMRITIGPYPDDGTDDRIESIHIDQYDTWSMDCTLALIIAPMLKQLKESTHGAPFTDNEDVPEELRSETDTLGLGDTHFQKWDWILDEMIWAFSNYNDIKFECTSERWDRVSNGLRLFGKYYPGLWD